VLAFVAEEATDPAVLAMAAAFALISFIGLMALHKPAE
jgi:hypothetical protein